MRSRKERAASRQEATSRQEANKSKIDKEIEKKLSLIDDQDAFVDRKKNAMRSPTRKAYKKIAIDD